MKFTIRDLIWLTIVVALVAGWWVDHIRVVRSYEWLMDLRLPNGWDKPSFGP